MKLRKRVRRVPETILVRVARWTIPLLSRSGVLRLSRLLGRLTYAASAKLRRISDENLSVVFGDSLTDLERKHINIASFQNFALVILDLFWFSRNTASRLKQYVLYDSSFDAAFGEEAPILITAHIGNWEIINLGCGAMGHPLTSVAMPLKNSFVDRELIRMREKTGSEISPRAGAIRSVIKALRNGRGTFLVMDQNTLPQVGGMFVPFFGLPVPVSKAAGALWARTKAPVLIVWCIPNRDGVYTVYAKPPLALSDEESTTEAVTALVTQGLEGVIRDHPNYWLWSYKRWRFYRDMDDASQYPDYAQSYETYGV